MRMTFKFTNLRGTRLEHSATNIVWPRALIYFSLFKKVGDIGQVNVRGRSVSDKLSHVTFLSLKTSTLNLK